MQATYLTFKKFPDVQSARGLQHFLIDNGIECVLADTSAQLGSAMAGELNKEYEVQLKQEDFERAEKLIEAYAEKQIDDLPDDYYLLTFTDEELYEVVLKHDEWSEFDYVLARRLLSERGKTIDEAEIKKLREQRIEDLSQPEGNQQGWVIAGYVLGLLGGFFGVITGYVLLTAKKTLPNGQVVPMYSTSDRRHGKTILILSIAVFVVSLAAKILVYSE